MQSIQWVQEYAFARHALVAGVAVGTLCSLLSVVVVLRRMAFIGQGISHAGFGGVGTASLLGLGGISQDLVVLLFCVGTAVAIGLLSRRGRVEPDSAIGILLVSTMAWGVLMENLSVVLLDWPVYAQWVGVRGARPSYEQLLFGSLLQVGEVGMWTAVVAAVVVLGLCALMFKEIVFFTFDEAVSRVFGVPAGMVEFLLLLVLAVAIFLSIRLTGFVLVTALLVIPGSTMLLLSRRLWVVLAGSWLVGLLGTVGGLMLSLEAGGLSSGPCIVGVLAVLFGGAYLSRALLGWKGAQAA